TQTSGSASRPFVLAQVADVIEADRLEVDIFRRNVGKGGLGQDGLGDVLYRALRDLVDERDVLVFTRGNAGDDLAPRDFRIDDGLAAAPPVVDHYDEILHGDDPAAPQRSGARQSISEKQN